MDGGGPGAVPGLSCPQLFEAEPECWEWWRGEKKTSGGCGEGARGQEGWG